MRGLASQQVPKMPLCRRRLIASGKSTSCSFEAASRIPSVAVCPKAQAGGLLTPLSVIHQNQICIKGDRQRDRLPLSPVQLQD